MTETSNLYFAYGSNLNATDWARWCQARSADPAAMRPLRPAILPDHELAFTRYSSVRNGGVLDIRPRSGYAVNGVLMAVTPAGWELLDMKEGVKSGAYERITARVVDAEGEWHRVTTYRVVPSNAKRHVPPHSHYVSVCAEGLRGHGLAPTHLLDAAADRPARPPAAGLFLSESMKRSFGMVLRDQDHWTLMPASVRAGQHESGALIRRQTGTVSGVLLRTDAVEDVVNHFDSVATVDENESARDLVTVRTDDGCDHRAWTYVITTLAQTRV